MGRNKQLKRALLTGPNRGLVLELSTEQLIPGLEIRVRGFLGDHGAQPTQVFIEFHDQRLGVHVWDGSTEDPTRSIMIAPESA